MRIVATGTRRLENAKVECHRTVVHMSTSRVFITLSSTRSVTDAETQQATVLPPQAVFTDVYFCMFIVCIFSSRRAIAFCCCDAVI